MVRRQGVIKGPKSSDPGYDSGQSNDDPFDANDEADEKERGDAPFGGANWKDDGYHGGGDARGSGSGRDGKGPPNGYKQYDGEKRIMWLDAPGIRNLAAADIKENGYKLEFKFEARVGTCKCTWEVLIEIDKTGKILHNEVKNNSCP